MRKILLALLVAALAVTAAACSGGDADGESADMGVAEDIVQRVAKEIGAAGVSHDDGIAKVSLVGAGMKTTPGIAAKMFRTLADEDVNIEMISTSTIRISVVVREADLENAVRAVHDEFELAEVAS